MKDKSITLVCITSIKHELSEFAIEKTLESIPIDEVIVFSDKPFNLSVGYHFFDLKGPINIGQYSTIILKELHKFIKTSHVLIIQYDGFATKKEFWSEDFLNYDFVGSVTNTHHPHIKDSKEFFTKNRNEKILDVNKIYEKPTWISLGGGFSLRSKKFLEACNNIEDRLPMEDGYYIIPEDMCGCFFNRKHLEEKYDIKFAPIDIGMNFSCELYSAYDHCLGFHGWYNIPFFLSEEECFYYMENLKSWKESDVEMNYRRMELHHLQWNCKLKSYVCMVDFLEKKYKLSEFWSTELERFKKERVINANT